MSSPASRTKKRPSWLYLLPLIALWSIPVAVVAITVPLATARESQGFQKAPSAFVVVGSRLDEDRTSVDTVVDFGAPESIVSPSAGLVTAVFTPDGGAVTAGEPLFAIDYTPVVAFKAAAPLYRDLTYGDTGADARVLAEFLSSTGRLPAADIDDRISAPVVAAIKRFQASVGQKTDGVFRAAYGAFVPLSTHALGAPIVQVGDTVAAGTAVYAVEKPPTSMSFVASDQDGSLEPLAGSPLVFQLGARKVSLTSITPSTAQVARVYDVLRQAQLRGTSQFTATTDDRSSGKYSGGLLYLSHASRHGVVPNSALYVSPAGHRCVFARSPTTHEITVARLALSEATPGELGLTSIDESLVGETVLRDPRTLTRDALAACK